jgi:hypothetical protein
MLGPQPLHVLAEPPDRPSPAHPLGQHRGRHVRRLFQQRPHPGLEHRERRRPGPAHIPRRRIRLHSPDHRGPRDPQPLRDPRLRHPLSSQPPDQRPVLQSDHSPIVECSLLTAESVQFRAPPTAETHSTTPQQLAAAGWQSRREDRVHGRMDAESARSAHSQPRQHRRGLGDAALLHRTFLRERAFSPGGTRARTPTGSGLPVSASLLAQASSPASLPRDALGHVVCYESLSRQALIWSAVV